MLFIGAFMFASRIGFPYLVQNKDQVEQLVSDRSGLQVSIESIDVVWEYPFPGIDLNGLKVSTPDGELITEAKRLRAMMTLKALLSGKIGLDSLTVYGAQLKARRDMLGRWWIGGLEFRKTPVADALPEESGGKLVDIGNIIARLGAIEFRQLQLSWLDEYRNQRPFIVNDAVLRVSSDGKLHHISLDGEFPKSFCTICRISADVSGRIDQPQSWNGRLYVEASQFHPDQLPVVFTTNLPYTLTGTMDFILRTELYAGRPRVFQGHIYGEELKLKQPSNGKSLALNNIDADLLWRQAGDGWVLETDQLRVGVKQHGWSAGKLWMAKHNKGVLARVGALNIADMGSLISALEMEDELVSGFIDKLQPQGVLRDVVIDFPASTEGERQSYELNARFYELGWQATGRVPAAAGLDGTVSLDQDGGSIELNTTNAQLDINNMFRDPIEIDRLSGDVHFKKQDAQWLVSFNDMDISNRDLKLHGSTLLRIPVADNSGVREAPYVSTNIDIISGSGLRASRYFPVNVLKPKLLGWLDNSIKDGRIIGGHAVYEGKVDELPFNNNNGRFEVTADIRKGVLRFLPGWPALRDLDMSLMFRGTSMNITARSARLNGMQIRQTSVTADDFNDPTGRRLQINGSITGSALSLMGVVNQVRSARDASAWAQAIPGWIAPAGQNKIRLSLDYDPKSAQDIILHGDYRPHGVQLKLAGIGLKGSNIGGIIQFDHHGISAGNIFSTMLGDRAWFSIARKQGPDNLSAVIVSATGGITAAGIADNYGRWLRKYLSGQGQWKGEFEFNNGRPWINIEAGLDQMRSELPAPLNKSAKSPAQLSVVTTSATADNYSIEANIPGLASLTSNLRRYKGDWQHDRTAIGIGRHAAQVSSEPGVNIAVSTDKLDMDEWRQQFTQLEISGDTDLTGFNSLQIDTSRLSIYDRHLGRASVNVRPQAGRWLLRLDGTNIIGAANYRQVGRNGMLEAELTHLNIPDKTYRQPQQEIDVRSLPAMRINSQQTIYGDMYLGAMKLKANDIATGWNIEHARFDSDELHMTVWGELKRMGGRNHGDLSVTASSGDLGKALKRLAMPGQVQSGKAYADASLSWKGVDEYTLTSANGKFNIKAEDGSFLKLEQGAGKMLGIFDFDAFSRYARLDFSTVFGKGYAFDQVKGSFELERGHIYTRDLKVKGPSADMVISGRVGVVDEDYDFVVGINPSVSDTLAFASWGLGVPQVGAAILLFNRLFKKDIEASGRLTYLVQGSWDKPEVRRVEKSINSAEVASP
jgi:uncharacterized protein (TIGR02099 family)